MRGLRIDNSITRRDEASLNKYLAEIDKLPLIRAEEEVMLGQKIRAGDKQAVERLVRANLRFVVSCAKKYQHMGLSLNDLVNEGNLGLIKAAELFDETRGFKFISYAVWWIRQSIMQALGMDTRMIRLPLSMIKASSEVRQAAYLMEQQLERMPTREEIASSMQIPEDSPALDHAFGWMVSSLDNSASADSDTQLWEILEDPNSQRSDELLLGEATTHKVSALLAVLSEREQRVLRSLFGLDGQHPMGLEDVGRSLGMTAERVRQLKNEALKRLRKTAEQKGIMYG